MNKYMGFFELKALDIPTVPWREFTENTVLDEDMLWTLRVAVESGSDFNLPRYVGVMADEAYMRGRELLRVFRDRGMVIYYPYFIAEKSGVTDISRERIIIEAVDKDLWNLVTYGRKDFSITIRNEDIVYQGDKSFISSDELDILRKHTNHIKYRFRDLLDEGRSIIAEWSFAYNTDTRKQPIGDRYTVFYELRSIQI
jgi:hypothetical protein